MSEPFFLTINSLNDLQNAASLFLEFLKNQPHKFVAFHGEMGAGKTTFITALLKEMGVESNVSSPTFALINEFHSDTFGKIFHCDFYRLKTPSEALELGVEEMFDDTVWCFAEWPEKLGNLLPDKFVNVRMTDQNGSRILEAKV